MLQQPIFGGFVGLGDLDEPIGTPTQDRELRPAIGASIAAPRTGLGYYHSGLWMYGSGAGNAAPALKRSPLHLVLYADAEVFFGLFFRHGCGQATRCAETHQDT